MSAVDAAIAALRAGGLAVIPTDTVYGLAADGRSEDAARALYAAKGRDAIQPTALLFASVDVLEEHLPELPARARAIARALLPGPLTLVLPNPGRRFGWLNAAPSRRGRRPRPGHPRRRRRRPHRARGARRDERQPARATRSAAGRGRARRRSAKASPAVVDGGELPGTPSTVVDLTAAEPVVLREGAVPARERPRTPYRLLTRCP